MSLLSALLGRKTQEPAFDPKPGEVLLMPERPYRVLHVGVPFYSDPECSSKVTDAYLVVLCSEDPKQSHHPIECMPTRKHYEQGQVLRWEINPKRQWTDSWYINPETGSKEKAWTRAVEFLGDVVRTKDKP